MVQREEYSIRQISYESYIEKTKTAVESELLRMLPRISNLKLYNQLKYVLLTQGKRLRPVIVVLSAQSVGGKREAVAQLALSIELVHAATLVHDDILDQDEFRRNAPAVHAKWCVRDAVLVGDALASLGINLATDYGKEILKIVSECALLLSDGEYMDVAMATEETSEAEYLEKIRKKSASLFKAAAHCGAFVGGGSQSEIKSLADFGEHFGMAYQIKDDLSDITTLRNGVQLDLERRATLPLVHLYEIAKKAKRRSLLENLKSMTFESSHDRQDLLTKVSKGLEKSGSLSYCRQTINDYVEKSIADVESLKDSVYKSHLIKLACSIRATD